MGDLKTGQVQVYTGDGKGKTTAALGLALRAAGAGLRVFFGQFCKGREVAEHAGLALLGDRVTIRHTGSRAFITGPPTAEDVAAAGDMLAELREALQSGEYSVVIADELNVALDLGLVTLDQVHELLDVRPPQVELVITGRNAPSELIQRADLVTEMLPLKHPYDEGLQARRGIEY
ncbi:MAG: cob(I)yrinic acid a,c-diamide adenosyltransferase [Armatimonadetes bacterium]|nr:cob(I)yrinic acid a,c-diamide adenosyltransferase [Armatimonadota bacterium]